MTGWMTVLADATQSPAPAATGTEATVSTAGVLALLSFTFLVVAVVLLYRSMRTQLNKVSPDLPEGPIDAMREEDRLIIERAQARGAREQQQRPGPAASPGPAGD